MATAFEEMLVAVEADKIHEFSLVENEERDKNASLNSTYGRNKNRGSHLRSQVLASDDGSEQPVPRYLQRFKSKRTKQREEEEQ